MKKTLSLLGVFALFIAAPSFAQEGSKSEQAPLIQKVEVQKAEKAVVKPASKAQSLEKKSELKAVKIKQENLKAVEPKRKDEE